METITLRGHHLISLREVCLGRYSLEEIGEILREYKYAEWQIGYLKNIFQKIMNGKVQLTFTDGLDKICFQDDAKKCPNFGKFGKCDREDGAGSWGISLRDKQVIEYYNLQMGIIYSNKKIIKRLRKARAGPPPLGPYYQLKQRNK